MNRISIKTIVYESLLMHSPLTNVDLLFIILSCLDIFDLLSVQKTSRAFREISRKVIEVNVGYYFGSIVSKKFTRFEYDFSDIISQIKLPYDIFSTIIKIIFTKGEPFKIIASTKKTDQSHILGSHELRWYRSMTFDDFVIPVVPPCLYYNMGFNNLLVVYYFQGFKKFLRIYKNVYEDYISVVSGVFDDSIHVIELSVFWKTAEVMFVIHNDCIKEKTPEGKYYITPSEEKIKIREECHLMTFTNGDFTFKIDSFVPKNKELLLKINLAHVVYTTKSNTLRIFCGLCLPKNEMDAKIYILDLLGKTDNGNGAKKQKLSDIILVSLPLFENGVIQMGINHSCSCIKRKSSSWVPLRAFLS